MKLFKAKSELQALSHKISTTRKLFRQGQSAASKGSPIEGLILWKTESEVHVAAYEFRHYHIAYCLLRGRTYEEIERVCYNPPDAKLIEKYTEKIKAEAPPEETEAAHATS